MRYFALGAGVFVAAHHLWQPLRMDGDEESDLDEEVVPRDWDPESLSPPPPKTQRTKEEASEDFKATIEGLKADVAKKEARRKADEEEELERDELAFTSPARFFGDRSVEVPEPMAYTPKSPLGNEVSLFDEFMGLFFPGALVKLKRDRLKGLLPAAITSTFTVVIDLNGVLLTTGDGYRKKKRAGAQYLINVLAIFADVVIWTKESHFAAGDLIEKIDTHGRVKYRLYGDSCSMIDGELKKDLARLGRSQKTLIVLTSDPDKYVNDDHNMVVIPSVHSSQSDMADTALIDIVTFLESLEARSGLDVRPVLRAWEGYDIGLHFRQETVKKQVKQDSVLLDLMGHESVHEEEE